MATGSRDGEGGPRRVDPNAPLPAHLDPRGRHRGEGRHAPQPGMGKRRALVAVQVLSALLSFALLVGSGYVWWIFRDLNHGGNRLSILAGGEGIDGKDQNILIVGNDDRESATDAELEALGTGRDGGSLATDTMMIVHVPADGSKATLISLPRDTWVTIPGYGEGKLNSAYATAYTTAGGALNAKRAAGANLLIKTVSGLTGLTIDHYVQVDLLGFYRISRALGGVPVTMCQDVYDPVSGFIISKGHHNLKGKQALLFVRQRHGLPNGDLDRVRRQQYFLTSAFRQVASAGVIFKLQSLSNAIHKSVYMDADLKPLDLARQLQNLAADKIIGKTIPTEFGSLSDGTSILVVDPAGVKTFVNRLIGVGDSKLESAKPVDPATVVVDVFNAGSHDGAAGESADVLRRSGFQVGQVGTEATQSTATIIRYPDGMQAEAKTLAQYVPGAVYDKVDDNADGADHVTLVLGTDGLVAKTKPPATPTASRPAASRPPQSATPKPQPLDAGCIY